MWNKLLADDVSAPSVAALADRQEHFGLGEIYEFLLNRRRFSCHCDLMFYFFCLISVFFILIAK